jgi:hypothetical protein
LATPPLGYEINQNALVLKAAQGISPGGFHHEAPAAG